MKRNNVKQITIRLTAAEYAHVTQLSKDSGLKMEPAIRRLADKTWLAARKTERIARTVVLKLKTAQFRLLTRSHTGTHPPASAAELAEIVLGLRERVDLPGTTRYRLVGVGLSGFREPDEAEPQPDLFGLPP